MSLLVHVFSLNALAAEALPLKSTQVEVLVTGPYAELEITQVFANPNTEHIEAVYTFPLHSEAAVDGMEMRIGSRVIKGEVKKKEEAREVYEQAKENGQAAALTEEERPNVFTQSVANIPPGQEVKVVLHMTQPLAYEDGVWRFELPLTVGPKFAPPGMEQAEAEKVSPVVSLGPTGALVDIDVQVDMGLPLEEAWSPSHAVKVQGDTVTLRGVRPDRDFVLELDPAGDEPVASLLVEGDHFALTIEPPEAPTPAQIAPRELVFVIDTSCSQDGVPMEMSKELMRQALAGLRPQDTFRLIEFDSSTRALSPEALPATPANVQRGLDYVEAVRADGGTMMLDAVTTALDAPIDPRRKRIVVFLTDGYIGNDDEVIAAVGDHLGRARFFTFGIGSSVNRYLVEGMAEVGRGFSTVVLPDQDPAAAVADLYSRIATPVLTDIELSFGDAEVWGTYPTQMPDVFAGHPIRVVGRFKGDLSQVTVHGLVGGQPWEHSFAVEPVSDGDAIGSVWARARVKELERLMAYGENAEVQSEIEQVGLQYHLITRYTSMVAVEYEVINRGGYETLVQPSEVPYGVNGVAAAELSRIYMPPGDPVFSVPAPAEALSVVVLYPWGESAEMRWDPLRSRWYHRFLVPRDWPDGAAEVVAVVMMPDGSIENWSETLQIDSAAPELDVELVVGMGVTRVIIRPEEPLRSLIIAPVGAPDDAMRVDLRGRDQEVIEVVLPGEWEEVTVVAKDLAMNRIEVVAR